ncbi:MAG: asparagine synthase-related protein [Acidobacteriota bacterium]|nr:asparagine synthase-related protein [Blastocatellia bacterium]MDW8239330.1 asparagine synthase-related protein [Acidobacteriota bacterium]
MSGIVGIVMLDGAPVDRQLLRRMTEFMTYRGPDAQAVWSDGHVGFGHTLLRTTFESEYEQQPCSLDGQVWITADARVDGRADLIQALAAHGRDVRHTATDVELILHAYHVWGEACVNHLLGDFAFAIWDGHRRRLFCARDHFGLKPFYYAHLPNCLVFSNTLNCVRLHPDVSDRLNDLAIADFLMFGGNQDLETTSFADIRRLPPAHVLTWSDGQLRQVRYWSLPTDGSIRYKRADDYVAHFGELLRAAVADRLRTTHVGIWMSGGLDSTSVAAMAKEILSEQSAPFDLRAYTVFLDWSLPDGDRDYARIMADSLGIPIHFVILNDYKPYDRWDDPAVQRPEPNYNLFEAMFVDEYNQVAPHARVVLGGDGGDALLARTRSYFVDLVKKLRWGRLLADVSRYVWSYRKLPPLGFRSALKRFLAVAPPPDHPPFPEWLNPSLAEQLNLRARWEQVNRGPDVRHPTHPDAARYLLYPTWVNDFESYDPGVHGFPLETRLPYFDVRLVNYVLAIPPVPWCIDKALLRLLGKGRLPECVRLRPKTPLASDPTIALLQREDMQWLNHFEDVPELSKYVDLSKLPIVAGPCGVDHVHYSLNLRPRTLNYWLQQVHSTKAQFQQIQNGRTHDASTREAYEKVLR